MRKLNKFLHAPGTVIQASDRQYRVDQNGSWRRLPPGQEVKGIALKPKVPFCLDGRSSDGSFCWCFDCLKRYHPKVKNGL
jgi:hypothetical protein